MVIICYSIVSVRAILTVPGDLCDGKDEYFKIGDPNNVRAYFECNHLLQMIYKVCQDNLSFYAERQSCYWSCPLLDQANKICAGDENLRVIQNFYNCRSFTTCFNGNTYTGECKPGYTFNEELNQCNTKNNYKCEDGQVCPPTRIHMICKIGTCTDYYLCFDGVPISKKCSNESKFDLSSQMCTSNVKCHECPAKDDPKT